MSNAPTPQNGASEAGQLALQNLETQVVKARKSLTKTRALMIGMVIFVLAYMSILGRFLQKNLLEPRAAAKLATTYTAVFVDENGKALSQQLVANVPAMIRRLPDIAIDQLPRARQQFEARVQAELAKYAQQVSPQIAELTDRFLTEHQTEIKDLIALGQDKERIAQLGEKMEGTWRQMLVTKDANGLSAMDYLNKYLTTVQLVQQRIHRLANATDLSPEELQLRRAIAVLLHALDNASKR